MYGLLIPISGGKTLALKRQRVYIGRVRGSDRSEPLSESNAYCLFQMVEGWWHVIDLNCPTALKINGRPVKRDRLMPADEIEIGKHRFRINFEVPQLGGSSHSAARSLATRRSSHSGPSRMVGHLGRLVPVGGGAAFQLAKTSVTIGRKPPCDIVLPVKTVSGQHCELKLVDGYWRARDLDSHNGIRINSKPCDEGWVLPRQRLSIANQRFLLEYEGQGPPPVTETPDADVSRPLMDRLGLSDDDFQLTDDSELQQRKYRPL